MKLSCEACGKLFEAQKLWAKFCGPTCRKRASRAAAEAPKTAKIKPFRAPRAPEPTETIETPPPPSLGIHPLVVQTIVELEEAGVLGTVLGQTTLRLAEKLAGNFDTGSAMASLSREFRAVMQQALSKGTKKTDGLDELAARRLQKASGD